MYLDVNLRLSSKFWARHLVDTVTNVVEVQQCRRRLLRPFYKGRSQEKTHLLRLEFFLLRSPLDGTRSVLTYRTMCSVAGRSGPAVWVFSTSGFHRFLATKPVSSETSKAETVVNLATIVLFGTPGP